MKLAFGREDYWAAEQCDVGLRSGALKDVQLGGMEIQISMFHNIVNECLTATASHSAGAIGNEARHTRSLGRT
jgi:hypothetical protein